MKKNAWSQTKSSHYVNVFEYTDTNAPQLAPRCSHERKRESTGENNISEERFCRTEKIKQQLFAPRIKTKTYRGEGTTKKRTRLTRMETKSEQKKEKRIERRENTHRRKLFFSK